MRTDRHTDMIDLIGLFLQLFVEKKQSKQMKYDSLYPVQLKKHPRIESMVFQITYPGVYV
jgi:hypothetical protein